jgi:NhaP-type Na+/H+ or K+/H+ antiporter
MPTQNYILLAIAALMITSAIWFARRLWSALVAMQDDKDLSQRSRTFFSRQFRRRIQIAAMIGLSGVMLVATVLTPPKTFPILFIIFGSLSVFLLLWSILIALFDVISISMFYRRSRHWDDAQRAKIQYELEQKLREMQEDVHREDTEEPPP